MNIRGVSLKPNKTSLLNNLSWLSFVALFAIITWFTEQAAKTLGPATEISGYALFANILLLFALPLRKRFVGLRLIKVKSWMQLHQQLGISALALFILHIQQLWPNYGLYEHLISSLFYVSIISGLVGLLIQISFSQRLTQKGGDISYEQISDEINELRNQAEQIVLTSIKTAQSDTLARYYQDTLTWYFRRPRFRLSNLFGNHAAEHWINQQFSTVNRYLNKQELSFSKQLAEITEKKIKLDHQFALQFGLQSWLNLHVPIAFALLCLVLWHVLIVNIYL